MTDELEVKTGGSSQQIITERTGGATEQQTTWRYGVALFKFRLVEVAWWMIPVPILFGRWLVVFASAFLMWKILEPRMDKYALWLILLMAMLSITLIMLDAVPWYPIRWQWRGEYMPMTLFSWTINLPQWFVIPRVFLLIAPPIAWTASMRFVKWRYQVETIAPTASSPPIQPARASSIVPPKGSPIRFVDPDSDPPLTQEYIRSRLIPVLSSQKVRHIPLLETSKGDSIERHRVIDMLEAQRIREDFTLKRWKAQGWTRPQWETARMFLAEWGIITQPVKGQPDKLLSNIDDAIDFVEKWSPLPSPSRLQP